MSARTLRPWLDHPLAQDLLRFNLQPTRLMHPSRWTQFLPASVCEWLADPAAAPVDEADLHRHAASDLLERLQLPPVDSLDDPVLALAMAPPSLFERLTLCCGMTLLGPAIRRVITRDEVAVLEERLQPWGLAFSRRAALRCWDGELGVATLTPERADEQATALGSAVLDCVFEHAPPAVAERARMRLPVADAQARADVEMALGEPGRAPALALSVLQELDSTWLSSFPARP